MRGGLNAAWREFTVRDRDESKGGTHERKQADERKFTSGGNTLDNSGHTEENDSRSEAGRHGPAPEQAAATREFVAALARRPGVSQISRDVSELTTIPAARSSATRRCL